jgi:hypothetical protein
MQHFYKKSPFTQFLRKCSESIRTILLSNLGDLKSGLFLSTLILIAEKLRKKRIFSLLSLQFLSENTSWNKGLIILFPFIPQSFKNFILVQVGS